MAKSSILVAGDERIAGLHPQSALVRLDAVAAGDGAMRRALWTSPLVPHNTPTEKRGPRGAFEPALKLAQQARRTGRGCAAFIVSGHFPNCYHNRLGAEA